MIGEMMKTGKPLNPHGEVVDEKSDPKELDFIINYEIKYRMRRDAEEESEG